MGSISLVCLADGNWSGVTECLGRLFVLCLPHDGLYVYILISVNCGNPPRPTNGSISSLNGTVRGSVANYECDTGYKLVGNSSIVCQDDGEWSTPPVCLGMCENYYEWCSTVDCGEDWSVDFSAI